MGPKQPRVQSNAANPIRNKARILARGYAAVRTATTGEQKLARPLFGGLRIIIDGLPSLFAQFESDRLPGFLLPDRCAIRRVPTGGDILNPDGDHVTARSLLSIARLNMARSRARPSIWSFVRIDQTCLGRSGGLAPVSFPLFHGTRFGAGFPFT
jgi:hypothetical protein